MAGAGAAAPSSSDRAGVRSDLSSLLRFLGPPATASHSPHGRLVADHLQNPNNRPNFAFLPHNILSRRPPPSPGTEAVAERPPSPSPSPPLKTWMSSLALPKIRIPIPKNLPPGPLEIPEITFDRGSPPPVVESGENLSRKERFLRRYGRPSDGRPSHLARNQNSGGSRRGGGGWKGPACANGGGLKYVPRNKADAVKSRDQNVNLSRQKVYVAKQKMKKKWVVVSKEEKNEAQQADADDRASERGSSSNSRSHEMEFPDERVSDQPSHTDFVSEIEEDYSSELELIDDWDFTGEELDYEVVKSFSSEQCSSMEEDGALDKMNNLVLKYEDDIKNLKKHSKPLRSSRARSDPSRGWQVSNQRYRRIQRQIKCRFDIENFTPGFLSVYYSLVPPKEERIKQNQVLNLLKSSICKEWPSAKLHLYGSSANSFGFRNSDMDVCIFVDDDITRKHDVVMRLASVLQLNNFQEVEPIKNARVPIVKVKEPETEISCDICINNHFALANTKLLRDYAQIDVRLHQLAFIVKHWAKSRGLNETYRGTLSSYAYVLICINFLQLQEPAILPCLQKLEPTFSWTIDKTKCAYYDKVEELKGFSKQNRESIGLLIWKFFKYWAYHHDYHNDVISVRYGCIISKKVKDWTKRVGFDRHLLCIEDPFETSHDLGRVVDKHSIRILREEFERAADILQYDADPCSTLFEPYVPESMKNSEKICFMNDSVLF